jgi:hypothetical protein
VRDFEKQNCSVSMKRDYELVAVLSHLWRTNHHCSRGCKCGPSILYLLDLDHDDWS